MANFEGFSSRWGSSFGTYRAPSTKKKKDDDPGVVGFFKNLVSDVGDLVTGLPMGIKTMFSQSPTKTGKQIGLSVWQDWSPLFKGDVDEWWDNFTAHPLAPILDVAGLVTFGAGTAVRGTATVAKLGKAIDAGGVVLRPESSLVKVLRKAGGSSVMKVTDPSGATVAREVVGRGSTRTILQEGMPEVYRHYHRNPVVRMRQYGLERVGQAIGSSKATKTSVPGTERLGASVDSSGEYVRAATRGGIRGQFGDAARVNRAAARERSSRSHGFRAAMFSSMQAARKLFDPNSPMTVKIAAARGLEQNAESQFDYHAMTLGLKKQDGHIVGRGYTLVTDPKYRTKVALPKTWDGKGMADFHKRMAEEGNWMTDDPKRAMRTEDGKFLIVRKNAMSGYFDEMRRGTDFLDYLWNKPTMIWKTAVLAYSPRFFVNNVVGNSLMYFMATNPAAATRGLIEAYRENKHTAALSELEKLQGGAFKRNLAYESQGFGAMEAAEDFGGGSIRKARLKSGLYGVTHRFSEDIFRQATMHWAARRTPEYWANRSVGFTHEQAVQKSMAIPSVRSKLRSELDDVLGNYSHLNKAERQIKKVVPFYTWDRAILRHTRQMVLNRPYVAASMARLGEMGHEEFIKMFGKDVPHFLMSSVPLPGGDALDFIPGFDKIPGRKTILSTTGMNPYATVGELAQTGASAVGLSDRRMGETVGSQLNPLLVGAIESISGTKLISGAPSDTGAVGLLSGIYGQTAESVPQARLLKTILEGRPSPAGDKPLLFRGDTSQQLLALLGYPVKRYSPKTAEEIYWRQQGGRRKSSWQPSSENSLYPPNMPAF